MTGIKKGDGTMDSGGKPQPPEGENKYVFNGVVKLCGKNNETLRIEAEYAIDPDGTKPISCFCFLGADKGLESLMSIIIDSGVYKKLMAKDKSLPDPAIDGWDDEQVLKRPEFIEQLGIELIGCPIYLTTKHEPNEWKNEKDETIMGKNSRVLSVRAFDGKGGKSEAKGKKEESTEEKWD